MHLMQLNLGFALGLAEAREKAEVLRRQIKDGAAGISDVVDHD